MLIPATTKEPGGRLNNKDGLTRYGDSHVKDKTAVLSLTWKSPYVDNMVFILRRGPVYCVELSCLPVGGNKTINCPDSSHSQGPSSMLAKEPGGYLSASGNL